MGIAHTRWATHGKPSEVNAHPHIDCTGKIFLAHNGIIENYLLLKKRLARRGHTFRSETDTEVLAHLIESLYQGNLEAAVQKALLQVQGTFGLAVLHAAHPEQIIVARRGSPIVLGVGENESLCRLRCFRAGAAHGPGGVPRGQRSGAAGAGPLFHHHPRKPRREPGSNHAGSGPGGDGAWALSRISCSRRFSSSLRRSRTRCADG